ncbi:MAG TPA: protein kinase, partial [Allocoleopsis sp.]
GGFGDTYEVDDSGLKKVLKVLHNTDPKAIELFKQEAEVLAQLDHPGIPKVEPNGYFIYYTRTNQPIHCLIMEKIDGMTLEDYLKQNNYQPISERAAIRWLKQIVEILQEIHHKNYFHRDIKPSNIMLRENGQLVLIDFGTAREMTQTYLQRLQGQQVTGIISGGYTPMEQVRGSAVPQSDFFALGRTFVFLLTGKHPDQLTEDVNNGMLIWRNYAETISSQLADLLDNMMGVFPNNRPANTQAILQVINTMGSGLKTNNTNPSPVQNIYSPPVPPTIVKSPVSNVKYAGFWKRLLAYLIDLLIVGIFSVIIMLVYLYINRTTFDLRGFNDYYKALVILEILGTIGELFGVLSAIILSNNNGWRTDDKIATTGFIICLLIKYFYFAKLESSDNQGTFGKR